MPENYGRLLRKLLEAHHQDIYGLIELQNLDFQTLKGAIALPLMGISRLSGQLWANIFQLKKNSRVKLFRDYQLPVHRFKSMNQNGVLSLVQKEKIDLIINLRTRDIYQGPILAAPRLGCLNIHHGLLPEYRGLFCDLYALAEGRPAGFTIHKMEKRLDAGSILVCTQVSQGDRDYLEYLNKTIDKESCELIKLIDQIKLLDEIPQGIPNITDKPIYTKNPNLEQIRHFKKMGLIL